MFKQVTFTDVVHQNDRYMILLLDKEARQVIGIRTGFYEGTQLAWISQGAPNLWGEPRRQGLHQFMLTALKHAGGNIRHCSVQAGEQDHFFSTISLVVGTAASEIESRPSDSIALALLAGKPILLQLETAAPATWGLEDVYSRTTLGRPTQGLVQALAKFWQENDPRVYLNCAVIRSGPEQAAGSSDVLHEIKLVDMIDAGATGKTAIFRNRSGKTLLPVRMPAWEANNLASLPGGHAARPNSYRLAAAVLSAAGVRVLNAKFYALQGGVFLAALETQAGEISRHFEMRAVDAACLALELDVPLYATAGVLETAGAPPEKLYRAKDEIGRGIDRVIAELNRPAAPRSLRERLGQFLRDL